MGQQLLIPDPRPLDERLGRTFFREAPKRPGVYVMRDAADKVLYVGKANNLQQRLRNYRIANPDRMPRRHLRMLQQVARIELQFCSGESAALKRESKLLRSLKPRFNRADVWPGKTHFLVWRRIEQQLELTVAEVPETGWQRHGPLGGAAFQLRGTLARMLWLAVNPDRSVTELPVGWTAGRFANSSAIECRQFIEPAVAALNSFFWQPSDDGLLWFNTQLSQRTHAFERNVIEAELEVLKEHAAKQSKRRTNRNQLALL